MSFKVISFYKYTDIASPEYLQKKIIDFCTEQKILGRILMSTEGINGAVSGTNNAIENCKIFLRRQFPQLTFREQVYSENAYHKLVIRIRPEIVHFGQPVNITNTGTHLPAEELQKWYKQQEDFVIVDARNEYEFDVGRFKNAVKLPIQNFREFPEVAPQQLQPYKDKKIVLYCTGGIRCEKASAYLKEQGFQNVYQLDGGIINYANQVGDEHWEGGLFVFDDRLVSEISDPITKCLHCQQECEQYINCHNLDCDKLVIICTDCQEKWHKTCSQSCLEAPRQRQEQKQQRIIGVVQNYYAKVGVALIKVDQLQKNMHISFIGKTTQFSQEVAEIKDEDGQEITEAHNQLITIPVKDKVRKNDKVALV